MLQQIFLQSRKFSDIDISFNINPVSGDILQKTGVNSVVQSIMNLVQTNHYARKFHPEIGGNVRKLLFELADSTTASLLASEITDVISNFEPRATNVRVFVNADGVNGFNVTIETSIQNLANPITVSFFLARLR